MPIVMDPDAQELSAASSEQMLMMAERELAYAETRLEEAIAHLAAAGRYHKKATQMHGMEKEMAQPMATMREESEREVYKK